MGKKGASLSSFGVCYSNTVSIGLEFSVVH